MGCSQFILVLDDFIPEVICDNLIDHHRHLRNSRATQAGNVAGGYTPETKKSEEVSLYYRDPFRLAMDKLFIQARDRYFSRLVPCYSDTLAFRTRPPHLVRYPRYVGHMHQHVDMKPASVSREITFVGYLNDVTEGGETVFPNQNLQVRPKKGRVVVFPPFWMFPHYANVPESDDKYVVATIHAVEGVSP